MKHVEHTATKRIGPFAWPGALGLVVLMSLAPGVACAEDDQGSSLLSVDKKIIYEVLRSFGMTPKRTLEDQIDTRERAPLVVPASRVPPPPQAAPAARAPNWPAEADAGREAVKKRTASRKDIDPDQFTNPMRPSELAGAGAAAGAPSRSAGDTAMTDTMRPSQLGNSGGLFGGLFGGNSGRQEPQQQQAGAITAEPPRTRLIDPPAGYQTPSPSQPYGTAPSPNYPKPAKPADHALGDDVGL
jgi:hypothetical protein